MEINEGREHAACCTHTDMCTRACIKIIAFSLYISLAAYVGGICRTYGYDILDYWIVWHMCYIRVSCMQEVSCFRVRFMV